MNMVDEVRATDPYPPSRVVLDFDAEGRELMEEIMSTTKEKTPLRAHPLLRRHGRWVVPVAAAAAVAAVVAGGVVLRGGDDGADPAGPAGPANPGKVTSTKSAPQKPAQPKPRKSDPGLPPTAENLHHVVVNDSAWKISSLSGDAENGGSLKWKNGRSTLELNWYPADQYDAYLADRRGTGPARPATVLGQEGEAFRMAVDLEDVGKNTYMLTEPTGDANEDPGDNLRVTTMLPPVGDFYLEFDAFVANETEYAALMGALSRVNEAAWTAAIDRDTVTAGEGQAFLDQAGQGVPLPPGMTVTVADLDLPQSPYHARGSYLSKVLCGWADRYVDGDDSALTKLQASKDWAVLQAMDDEGDYPEAAEVTVQGLAGDRSYEYKPVLGCA